MSYIIRPLTLADADAVASWQYDGPYAFYNLDQDPEDLADFMDPTNWPERYFAVCDEAGDLVGYFGFEREDSGWIYIGLGMRPDLTGCGLGQGFLEAGLAFARARWQPKGVALVVAAFNERAIRLYEKVGFVRVHQYMQATNGGHYPFWRMVLAR